MELPTRNNEEPKIYLIVSSLQLLRNDETIISSISVTDIFFDVYYFGSAEGHEYPVL